MSKPKNVTLTRIERICFEDHFLVFTHYESFLSGQCAYARQ